MSDSQDDEARRWLKYASWDLETAERNAADDTMPPSNVCITAQQAAEKILKAALVFTGILPPRAHNLNSLRNLLPEDWSIRERLSDLSRLSVWVVESSYPTDMPDPTNTEARAAAA